MTDQTRFFDHRPKPLAGIATYAVAVLFITIMSAFVKKATEYHDPIEVLFYRGVIGLAVILIILSARRDFSTLRTARVKGHIGRALFGNAGAALMFWTYALMPMADATAFLFTIPLITTALSAIILKESVGPYRWSAVAVGFVGVLLISQPSGESYAPYAVAVALSAASCGAFVGIFLRDLGKTENALTTVFYFLLFGTVLSGLYMTAAGKPPSSASLLPLLGAGIFSISQLLIKTQAFRWAEASVLTPVFFTAIIWATLWGWLFWDDIPDLSVIIGVGIIISANLLIVWRQRQIPESERGSPDPEPVASVNEGRAE